MRRGDERSIGLGETLKSAVALCVGAAVVVAVWLLVVPWHLDEVDELGRSLSSRVDQNAGRIALVIAFGGVLGFALATVTKETKVAMVFTAGASLSWAVLFAWRAAASRTSGANLFIIPLVVAVIPVAAALPLVVLRFGRWIENDRP